ncbi:MAG: hypothetical protein DRO01_01265 [Thermoproteota archaeon]|nr:MAG: hypothetical protein DRO01_01265 [Candidatus Korarchaeota archaeon]
MNRVARITVTSLIAMMVVSAPLANSVPPVGMETPFPDESVVTITLNPDLTANFSGYVHRPFSTIEFSYYTRRGIPLAMGIRYEGYIELRRSGDALEGTYRLYITPNLPEGASPDLALRLWNSLQSMGSPYLALQELMKTLFGEGFLMIPRPSVRTDLVVNFTNPVTGKNLTGRGFTVEAPVRSETPFLEEYRIHFVLQSPQPPVKPDWVGDLAYEVSGKTVPFESPYPLKREGGVTSVYLDPITTALPKGAAYTLIFREEVPGQSIVGADPNPFKLDVNSVVWEFSAVDSPEGIRVDLGELKTGGIGLTGAGAAILPLVPPLAGAAVLVYALLKRKESSSK